MGYYADPFLTFFVRKAIRRSPLINRGYYARVAAVDTMLHRFISIARRTGDGRAQVVNLGAGMDTTFFRCYAELALSGGGVGGGASPPADPPALLWMDVDFPEITARKVSARCVWWPVRACKRHASRPPCPPPHSLTPHPHPPVAGRDHPQAPAAGRMRCRAAPVRCRPRGRCCRAPRGLAERAFRGWR